MPNIPPGTEVKDLSNTSWAARIGNFGTRVGRAMDVLTGRDFGPGVPLAPRTAPDSPEQTQGPRQYKYPVSVNTFPSPRRDQPNLTPFEQLRNLAAIYDVAALAIGARIEEMQGLRWSIVAKDKKQQGARQDDCDELTAFWEQPNGLDEFPTWLGMLLYDLFSIDALTLYKRPDLAGRLLYLDPVDGATIKPLLDPRGRALAYQQVLFGYPFSEYRRPATEAPDEQFPTFGTHELLYKPRWARAFSPYGCPPTEWIILRVNQAIRKQTFDLAYFTDGNIPDMLVAPPEDVHPDQVAAFEENFNAVLEGQDKARRKIRFFPWAKPDVKELRSFSYETELDFWMLRITCAAYGVPPTELGFTDTANRAVMEMSEAINERRGLNPLTLWLKNVLFDPLSYEYGVDWVEIKAGVSISLPGRPTRLKPRSRFDGLEWQWHFGEKDDALQAAQEYQIDLQEGVVTPDEVRTLKYGDRLTGPAPGKPALPAPGGGPGFGFVAKRKGDEPDWEARARQEKMAQRLFRQVYESQAKRIQAFLRSTEGNPDALQIALPAAFEKELSKFLQEVLPFFDDVAREAAEEAVGQLSVGVNWDKVNQAVLKLAMERAKEFARSVSNTSQAQTEQVIADWVKTGGTMDDLIGRVEKVWVGPRPDMAAINEVTNLYAEGNIAAWRESDVVKGYKVRTANDDSVCPICKPLNGVEFPLEDTEHRPSLHSRCRCGVTPVVKTPAEMRQGL
jgi:SPP1 gp7 family putative phage head morphogenesis protein